MLEKLSDEEFAQRLEERREKKFKWLDNQPKEIRNLVHNYGMVVVRDFMNIGVTNPRHIRHLVETVLNEFSPTRGSRSSQGIRSAPSAKLVGIEEEAE